jgi:hypothetical protein
MADAEKWAAGMAGPCYAIDDQTAIKVINGSVDVVSEGHWKLPCAAPLVLHPICDMVAFEKPTQQGVNI